MSDLKYYVMSSLISWTLKELRYQSLCKKGGEIDAQTRKNPADKKWAKPQWYAKEKTPL